MNPNNHSYIKLWTLAGFFLALSSSLVFAGEGWKLLGTQGVMNLVVIDKSQTSNEDIYRNAIAELCGVQTICQVLFWNEGPDVPRALPMTDQQVETQVAHWQYNGNTGLRRFLWSCKLPPDTPKDECF